MLDSGFILQADLLGNITTQVTNSSIVKLRKMAIFIHSEEKAANLLYFVTKNHSFTDGNKRIAAFLFLYFLDKNGFLYAANNPIKYIDFMGIDSVYIYDQATPPEDEAHIQLNFILQ